MSNAHVQSRATLRSVAVNNAYIGLGNAAATCATFKELGGGDALHATRVNKLRLYSFNEEPTTSSTSYSLYIQGYNRGTTRMDASPRTLCLAPRALRLILKNPRPRAQATIYIH